MRTRSGKTYGEQQVVPRDPPRYKPASKYALTKVSLDSYAIRHTQCNEVDGKYYIINISPYTNERLKESLPIITDAKDLEPGVYTYVVVGFDDESPQIFLVRVVNMYELGTKHHQLLYRVACVHDKCKKYKLYYAGEVQKVEDSNTVKFNFYSGTFRMKDKIRKRGLPKDIEYVKQLLEARGRQVEFVDRPLITAENLQLTKDDLNLYKEMGATIIEFDEKSVCDSFAKRFVMMPTSIAGKGTERLVLERSQARLYGGRRSRSSRRSKRMHKTRRTRADKVRRSRRVMRR